MLRFGFLRRFRVLAAMLFWAALSDGYGGYACCVEYSLEFLCGAATLIAPLAAENTRLFILLEMVQVVLCAENWVPGSSSQEVEADFFEWVEVESYEPEPPCTMINNTPHTFDLAGVARRRGWCEHELMYHIFEFGVPEGLRSMEAHMKALASVGEGSESVLQGRRILELAAEEDEANSVVFPGGVLQEDNSVNESSSSSWQWPWAASGEINMWNPLLSAMADVVAGPVLDDMVSEVDMGRVALTCHFSSDVLCSEMHQPHVFLPQVLSLDVLIPVNEVRKACGIPESAKSVQILFRGGHGLGVWDLEAHTTLAQWFSGGKRGGDGWVLFHDWRADPQFGGGGLQSGFGASFAGGFFIGGCWVAVLLARVRVVVFRVLGSSVSGHARTVAKLIVGVRGTVATDVGVLVISIRLGLGTCTLQGKAREVVWLVSMVKGSGVG